MLNKIFDDPKLLEKILKHLEAYELTNQDTDSKIKKKILSTTEYKNFINKSNSVDINDVFINKSFIIEQFKKIKKNKR